MTKDDKTHIPNDELVLTQGGKVIPFRVPLDPMDKVFSTRPEDVKARKPRFDSNPSWTPEQAARVRQVTGWMATLEPLLQEWRAKPPIGKEEVVVCPICQGRLTLWQSPDNGHIHGKCATPGCAHWVE